MLGWFETRPSISPWSFGAGFFEKMQEVSEALFVGLLLQGFCRKGKAQATFSTAVAAAWWWPAIL